ncbi:MAG: sigma-54-dependent Fis family transcriptional regulator [Candidatus Kapabacteria bacterium]|nr:sigma-54-dependent Fis family transcriptional regulator [Candidatus Kapabacteria bacterium]
MAKQNYSIVIIEDDPLVGATILEILSGKYNRVEHFTDPYRAIEELDSISPDLILLDIYLGHANGLDILERLRSEGITIPVIVMTAFTDIKIAVRAMKAGAEEFIVKPIDLDQLEVAVERALHNYDLRRQVKLLKEELQSEKPSEIIGSSDSISKAMNIAKIVAGASDTTALILGESGTGKELMARYIHMNSGRAKGPFITVNCGAIPKDLAENELFGYERGAFTGATEKVKQGRFEQANRGTILLDEVGELSMDMQVKLLRVLQERKFYRLGGTKEVAIDVRIIAATNRDLEKLCEEGRFREDLYYRLNVATIYLPPLRERGTDILLLATSFIKEFNTKFRKNIEGFAPDAADVMQNYVWKGNIRELRNVVERAVLLEQGNVITREQLSFLRMDAQPSQHTFTTKPSITLSPNDLEPGTHQLAISKQGAPLATVVRELVAQTLAIAGGGGDNAAKMLGITPAKLKSVMEEFGMEAPKNGVAASNGKSKETPAKKTAKKK